MATELPSRLSPVGEAAIEIEGTRYVLRHPTRYGAYVARQREIADLARRLMERGPDGRPAATFPETVREQVPGDLTQDEADAVALLVTSIAEPEITLETVWPLLEQPTLVSILRGVAESMADAGRFATVAAALDEAKRFFESSQP